MKKILIITSEFPPEPGGIGNHAYNLANHLSKNSFDVLLISDQRLKSSKIEGKFDKNLTFKVIRTRKRNFRVLMYFKRVFQYFYFIRKNDIIIASGKFPLLFVGLATYFFKKKFIVVIHGSEVNFRKSLLKNAINFSLTKFHHVIAVSNYTKSLISFLKLKNINVIYNGYEINKAFLNTKYADLKGYPSLITVGTLSQRKGQHNILNSLPEIIKNYPDIHYHLVGKSIEKENLISIAKKLRIENYITFYGDVEEEEKIKLLKGSDIFVMLSENTESGDVEGFGIALLEANSLGIPNIGAIGCGIEEAIKDYESGILIDSKNSVEFKNAIDNILMNYNVYQANSKIWASNFSWNRIVKKYIEIISL